MKIKTLLYCLICIVSAYSAQAQNQSYSNPDSLIRNFYQFLSGPAGPRNWEKYKSFFHEKAVLGSIGLDAQGKTLYRSFTPTEYAERNDGFFKSKSFNVKETHREVQQFGGVMHIFSTYHFAVDNGAQSGRGVNDFQLINDGTRWWIISIQWTNERPDLPLPKQYDK